MCEANIGTSTLKVRIDRKGSVRANPIVFLDPVSGEDTLIVIGFVVESDIAGISVSDTISCKLEGVQTLRLSHKVGAVGRAAFAQMTRLRVERK